MFRKLYWVTEQVKPDGESRVTGVFTSIPNLVKEGLANNHIRTMRLTLTKLDCVTGALGTWMGPRFDGLPNGLEEFVRTEEFSAEHCELLVEALGKQKAAV